MPKTTEDRPAPTIGVPGAALEEAGVPEAAHTLAEAFAGDFAPVSPVAVYPRGTVVRVGGATGLLVGRKASGVMDVCWCPPGAIVASTFDLFRSCCEKFDR